MSVLLEKELKTIAVKGNTIVAAKGRKAPAKKEEDLDDEDVDDETPVKKGGTKKATDDEDEDDVDDADAEEGDDDWDPDFEEFDLPKSRKGKGGKDAEEEEDFKVEEDEDFKELDLFDDGGFDDEEEDF